MARRFTSDTARATVSTLVALAVAIPSSATWVAAAAGRTLSGTESVVPYYLVFWPAFTVVYLGWTHLALTRLAWPELADTARRESTSRSRWWNRWAGPGDAGSFTLGAAVLAVVVTISIAQVPTFRASTTFVVLGLATVASSWALMVYSFAQDYLRLDVALRTAGQAHLDFHTESRPRFGDYLTFAVLVSTMAATISAGVPSRAVWKKVRGNVLMAFTFNSVVVAMMVSLLFGGLAEP